MKIVGAGNDDSLRKGVSNNSTDHAFMPPCTYIFNSLLPKKSRVERYHSGSDVMPSKPFLPYVDCISDRHGCTVR